MFDFTNAIHCKFKEEENPPPSKRKKQVAYLKDLFNANAC